MSNTKAFFPVLTDAVEKVAVFVGDCLDCTGGETWSRFWLLVVA
jgi:hypothetical protein